MNNKTVTTKALDGTTYDVPVDQLTWRPSAYAIIVRDGQLLLVRELGMFHLPGGGVELGEAPEAAVVREVTEETGLRIARPELVGSLTSFFSLATTQPSAKQRHVQSLLLYYTCELIGGTMSTDKLEDHERAMGLAPEWVPLAELDAITVGTTVDWRPIVKQTLGSTT